jgi:putative SOS response-associated peptidase YedK
MLAGIWDSWTDKETDETLNSFSVVTTEANELMAQIHNTKLRMPLILPKEKEKPWLDLSLSETQTEDLMIPIIQKI